MDEVSLFKQNKIVRDFTEYDKKLYQKYSKVLFQHQDLKMESLTHQSLAVDNLQEPQNIYLLQANSQQLFISKIRLNSSPSRDITQSSTIDKNKITLFVEWHLSPESGTHEQILYATYLEPSDPNHLLVITRMPKLKRSRVYLLVLSQRCDDIPSLKDWFLTKSDSFTSREKNNSLLEIDDKLSYSIKCERVIQLNQVSLTDRIAYGQPRTFVTVDTDNNIRMHEIVSFKSNQVPEKFLRHQKINFTHECLKGLYDEAHKKHSASLSSNVELVHLQIERIEIIDSEYLVVTYHEKLFFDIFNLTGMLLVRKYIQREYPNCGLTITSLDKVLMRRSSNPLQKRSFESKIIVSGTAV